MKLRRMQAGDFSRLEVAPVVDCAAPKAAYLSDCPVLPLCPDSAVTLFT
ncbi:hypothetical protein [Methylosinus sp. Sm6]|nr:hypothetical protein [Methylosinus sp. Sm6]MBY6244071.1 hypothetical protein [Methylosinus sp. Sm6]